MMKKVMLHVVAAMNFTYIQKGRKGGSSVPDAVAGLMKHVQM